jgi:C4-dicarboxylate-binding protein DctP
MNTYERRVNMKRFKGKKFGLVMVIAISLMLSIAISDVQAKKIVIKASTVQMPRQQMGRFLLKLADVVNGDNELKDKVQVNVYPSAQLYSGEGEIQAVSKGELEMAFVIGSKPTILDPAFQVWELPFVFPSIDGAIKILGGEIGKELFAKLDKYDIVGLGMAFSGTPVISNSKKPLLWPKDFEGMKLRSYGRITKSSLEALGATAIVTASEETFSALQQGMIDGLITPNDVYMKRKYYTIQKYVTDTGTFNWSCGILLVSTKFWNGLPEDVREKLGNILSRLLDENNREMVENNQQVFKDIEATGNQIFRLTPEQQVAWKKATRVVYDKFGPEIGMDLIKKIEAKGEELSK